MSDPQLDLALSELTPAQSAAVNWGGGAMLVLAGPGSGKTRVLTTRIAKLLADTPDRSFRVLALTFTNKAADEMSARVTALVPNQERRALVGTFHSFCMQILQQHGAHVGIRPDFTIYSLDADRLYLLKDVSRQLGDDIDETKLLAVIDKLKANLVGPDDCMRHFTDPSVGQKVEATYRAYEEALRDSNALDFGSLIAHANKLITSLPGVANRYRSTYAYWMFDEFQDTTVGQYNFVKALAGDKFRNILSVADDDQIIYQWNGASYQQIQRFRQDFSPQELQLPTNYRCPPSIVAAANRLVVHNRQRTATKLPLESGKTALRYPDTSQIQVFRYVSDDIEAAAVAEGISRIERSHWGGVVVLARTRALLEKIFSALGQRKVSAVIAQRRDSFRSAEFLWLVAMLRQILRPLDKRGLETLVGAFNRWFDVNISVQNVVAAAEISSRAFLDEWAIAVESTDNLKAIGFARLAAECGREPSRFTAFVDLFLRELPNDDDVTSDLAEDRAAWTDLSRSISKAIGRDASLEKFLQELSMRSKEPPISAGTVTLMTIHGAKGREFDHVYVAGLAEDILPSFHSLKAGENSAEMEEERRNCFVAITRAREWLCLSYADSYRGWQKRPSRFLSEMGLSLPDTAIR